MSGRSINDLPKARRKYRQGVRTKIESVEDSCIESLMRARSLRHEAEIGAPAIDPQDAFLLARKLERSALGEAFPKSLACPRFMRKQRLRLGSSLWQLVDGLEDEPFTTVTLVSHRWAISGEDLSSLNPRRLLNAVRTDLNRCGALEARGAVYLALDGEFYATQAMHQPHVHGLAIGEMIDVVDCLRELKKYEPTKGSSLVPPIRRPVWINRAPLTNLPDPLTYLLKRYWTCHWIGGSNSDRSPKNSRVIRIPEPYHSQWLLWMDRLRLSDLTLLMGMYVGKDGLTLSN